jgi:asparagine synthase (glutamine-hydrolysing)
VFRFLALVWHEQSVSQARQAELLTLRIDARCGAWHSALRKPGLRVWCAGSRAGFLEPSLVLGEGSIILGRVFERHGAAERVFTRATSAEELVRLLVEQCWGSYVALLRNSDARRTYILRDPGGAMRCFHTVSDGVQVLCSNTEDCVSLGLRFTTDWDYVAAELANRAAMGWKRTGLREIEAIGPGECLEIDERGHARTRAYWDPIRFAADTLLDPREAACEVRRIVRECVHAWASCHSHAALLLSGGLDSSVILSCLRNAPNRPRISCLNYFHGAPRADERSYARLAATSAGCGLTELERATNIRLESLLDLPNSARPSYNRLDQVLHAERTTAWAKEAGATAVFTGDLGDQLFGQQLTDYAAIDCAHLFGAGRRLFAASRDVARIGEVAVWRTVLTALAFRMSGLHRSLQNYAARQGENPYVRKEALERFNYRLRDQWFDSVAHLPVGKRHHIASLLSGQAYLTAIADESDPDWVAPLGSQPILELCLRLPLHVLIDGGYERALFRRAFAGEVAAEIAWRRTKGTSSTQRLAVYRGNAGFLRGLLLDGLLADVGLLDIGTLARDLDAGDYRRNLWLERCIRVETWLRIWNAQPAAAVYSSSSARYVYKSAS